MATQFELICQGKRINVKADQLIKQGGEAAVYRYGAMAIKLYHQPAVTHEERLRAWLQRLRRTPLPANFIVPQAPVVDASGRTVGLSMPLLPPGARCLKQLTQPGARQLSGWSLPGCTRILTRIWQDLSRLHQLDIVVGDLSDHNIFVDLTQPDTPVFWLDTDSYQFGRYPGQVMQPAFAAPWINGSSQPQFSPESDIYAFHVLLCKVLLWVHPFGGVHKTIKSLHERQRRGCWALSPGVIYPRLAQPPGILSPALGQLLVRQFTQVRQMDQQRPFPVSLLNAFAASLARCGRCGLDYSQMQPHCPACRQLRTMPSLRSAYKNRWLIPPGRYDALLTIQQRPASGRLQLVAYKDGAYCLLQGGAGGHFQELPLFAGGPGFQFGLFDRQLLVQPESTGRQMIFSLCGDKPRLLEQLILPGQNQHLWTTTPAALYRRAGDFLNRGQEAQGYFVEEIAFPVRPSHLTLWPSPWNDQLVGRERQFARSCYFVWRRRPDGRGSYHELAFTGDGTLADSATTIAQSTASILLVHRSRSQLALHEFAPDGSLKQQWAQPESAGEERDRLDNGCWHAGAFWLPGPGQIRRLTPAGSGSLTTPPNWVDAGVKLSGHPAGLLLLHHDALALIDPD